jgi:hypothetical protein
MATFVYTLAWDDPLGYVLFASGLFRDGTGWLIGRKDQTLFKPSKDTRLSKTPPKMNASDWLVLASLRDHLNGLLRYRWDAHIPVLSDIPLVRVFPMVFGERIAAINWPADLADLLSAVGYRHVINDADVLRRSGTKTRHAMVGLLQNHYRVMMLISVGMLIGGGPSNTAEHWVRLLSYQESEFGFAKPDGGHAVGVRFTVFDPQVGETEHWDKPRSRGVRRVPDPSAVNSAFRGEYIPMQHFMDHYYGFVAGKR